MSYQETRDPGPIPPRWLHCPRKSAALFVNKFIAFKTPLDAKFDGQVSLENRFPPSMLFDSLKSYKCEMGLWIDLTNTTRFYDKEEVMGRDCKYVKLPCRGHGETPSADQTQLFIQMCKRFIAQNPLKAIGVHCTHGFNRTGFMLIAYAVSEMDWSLDSAVQAFSRCRDPGIYKQDYLLELYRRYDDPNDVLAAPEKPSWCFEDEEEDEDEPNESLKHDSSNGSRKRDKVNKKAPVFMEGVGGVDAVSEQPMLQNLQWKFQDFCHWTSTGFPGCQPVSMDQSNIFKLKKPYMVSWKADGTRYMMMILGKDQVYFADRDHCIFKVDGLTFPHPNDKEFRRHLTNTVLDGEMVIDNVIEKNSAGVPEQKAIPRYLVYDVITCDGDDVSHLPFRKRYDCIERMVINPRRGATAKGIIKRHEEPFGLRRKDFFDIHSTKSLLSEKFRRQLSHEPDGLIFQPREDHYVAGRCDDVLKWKPSSHNSVDFKLKIVQQSGEGLVKKKIGEMYVGGLSAPFANIKVSKAVRDLDGKIIECRLNEKQEWELMRERTDKSYPNAYSTAQAVINSIRNPVTTEMLLNFIEENCPKPPPPQQKRPSSTEQKLMPPPKIPKF